MNIQSIEFIDFWLLPGLSIFFIYPVVLSIKNGFQTITKDSGLPASELLLKFRKVFKDRVWRYWLPQVLICSSVFALLFGMEKYDREEISLFYYIYVVIWFLSTPMLAYTMCMLLIRRNGNSLLISCIIWLFVSMFFHLLWWTQFFMTATIVNFSRWFDFLLIHHGSGDMFIIYPFPSLFYLFFLMMLRFWISSREKIELDLIKIIPNKTVGENTSQTGL